MRLNLRRGLLLCTRFHKTYEFQCRNCFPSSLLAKQVDLTEYVEKHEFVFDAVLNEEVSNDEVSVLQLMNWKV